MSLVKVWNLNKYEHREEFKGQLIVIPPGGSIEMDYVSAVDFQGQCTGLPPGDHPNPEKFFKMIEVEKPTEPLFKDDEAAKKLSNDPGDTSALVNALKELKAPDPEVAALKEQVAKLTALLEGQAARNKGGRPKKVANG